MASCRNFKTFAVLSAALAASCWSHHAVADAPPLVQAIDETKTVELVGNTRPEAKPGNDRGRLPGEFAMQHMQLLLKRAPQTEQALENFIASAHDESSPDFHHWLTAEEFGERFGPSRDDIAAVCTWLSSHGFTVNGVSTGRMMIDFSGTAVQVQEAFHTEIHRLNVHGVSHIANMSNPRIPEALHAVVEGVVSLNDFRPHTLYKPRTAYSAPLSGYEYYIVTPSDLATIYNFNPEFTAGISGQGQTIVVIEDSNAYKTEDWGVFRKVFGLSSYTGGKLSEVHPAGSSACANPGVVTNVEGEVELDMEWASAAAPSATIEIASCADTSTTFGGLIALQNLVNAKAPPAIVSISYGECEVTNGATQNAAYNATYQQAVALGISVFVAAGDTGAAMCDAGQEDASHGIGVNGFASTPYNVAVGGTDFEDTYAGTISTYWTTTNTKTYRSALSYVPEIPWNDSCAGTLISQYLGYATPYGSAGFCNSPVGGSFLNTIAGGGGPSGCATGSASVAGVVGGSCRGYAKPSWQVVLNNPADKIRDLPDVSLFAANGVWGHFYVFCDSFSAAGSGCTGAPVNWAGGGGTSFAAPIMAGIQALINQEHGSQGNPNVIYYRLAALEYGTAGKPTCASKLGKEAAAACIFYDLTVGDMDLPCAGSQNCYTPSGTYGILSSSDSIDNPTYRAGIGWDRTSGIGSVNVANLVKHW